MSNFEKLDMPHNFVVIPLDCRGFPVSVCIETRDTALEIANTT